MITHPKSTVAFCPEGGATILRGAATHLYPSPIMAIHLDSLPKSDYIICVRPQKWVPPPPLTENRRKLKQKKLLKRAKISVL